MTDLKDFRTATRELSRWRDSDNRRQRTQSIMPEGPGFLPPFELTQQTALPSVLLQQYDNVQFKCFTGMFPEMKRAYMTFDNRLFLWKYDDERDFNVWDGLDQIIVSVGIVQPKEGVFVETIRYLLVLTTPVEIVVLGVSFAGDDVDGEMMLQPTALSVPTDDVNMLQVVGTPAGRIFLSGNDGNLYELEYQSPGGWFSKKCRKRNLTQSMLGSYLPFLSRLFTTDPILQLRFDRTRNIVYALTSSSSIHGYWLGRDGSGSISQFAVRSQLQNDPSVKARVYGPNADLSIAAIFPVTASESNRIHLIAICTSGVRLYFTTSPSYSDKPYALQIVHVDHPVRDMRNRTCSVQSAFFAHGCLIMAADLHPDTDQTLFGLHFDMLAKERGSASDEPCAGIRLAGTAWALEEVALPAFVNLPPELMAPPNVANELATQHFIASRKFLCLTSNGLYTIERRRPLDQLVAILGRSQGNIESTDELKTFFSLFGEAEACAMCLVIATCQASVDGGFHRGVTAQIRDWATAAFLFLGSNTPERKMFGHQTQYSDRYNGFGLYLARLLQPVWQLPINRITAYSPDELRTLRDNLSNLLSFAEQTRFVPHSGASQQQQHHQQQQQHREPRLLVRVIDNLRGRTPNHQEQTNLSELTLLLARACEAITMLVILLSHDVDLLDKVSSERAVSACPFSEFVTMPTGIKITNLVVAHLIKAGSNDQQQHQTEEICRQLAVNCPLFFNQNDREHFSAVKKLREASLLPAKSPAREALLAESLHIFRKVAGDLSFSDVFAAVEEMRTEHYYQGMVELSLAAAQSREKQRPNFQEDRLRCYEAVVKTLEHVGKSPEEAMKTLYRRLKKQVLQDGAEECLRFVFSWYLQQGLQSELMDIESPLLEAFLREHDLQLLAEYYTSNQRFGDAASTYVSLAEVESTNLGLTERCFYLGQALANVKQADATGGLAENEVRLLQEKSEVAQIQQRIFMELQARQGGDATHAGDLERLNGRLYDISTLYNQFAWPHQMWLTCLLIMYTANHECPRALVEKLWTSIVEQDRRNLRDGSFATVTASIARKVEHVARLSSLSSKVFPVDIVSELLESISLEMRDAVGYDGTWVAKLLLESGVSFSTLYDLYFHSLVSTEDRAKQMHYSVPLRFVVTSWMQVASHTESVQFRNKRLPFAVDEIILRLQEVPAKEEVKMWEDVRRKL